MHAGSPIAALFLKRFVTATPSWLHVDLYAWNPKERPGRPVGAEAQCVRSVYRLIRTLADQADRADRAARARDA